jgi:hypothetical protein
MPRRPGRRPATIAQEGADANPDQALLAAWGLEPAQWRPVGSMAAIRTRGVLIWRLDGATPRADVALRARRAYDRLGELGVTLAADETPRGIEVTMPLSRVGVVLRTLGEWAILPDVVCIADAPADELRRLRREIASWRGRVALEIGTHETVDPVAELRARVRLS